MEVVESWLTVTKLLHDSSKRASSTSYRKLKRESSPIMPQPSEFNPHAISQYSIWYKGIVIEDTGYFKNLPAALQYAKSRYSGKGVGMALQPCYPHRYDVKFDVATGKPLTPSVD